MRPSTIALMLAALVATALPARAHDYKLGPIVIQNPWARATPAKVGGAYLTLRNTGAAPDRLLKVASPAAARIEIHETRIESGMAMMRPVGTLELKPGATVELKPGGYHLMLMGLAQPLKMGGRLKLTLTFEKAGTIEIEATVERAGAPGPAEHKH